jgi:hypothetical protein
VIQPYHHALNKFILTSRGETHSLFLPAILNKLSTCTLFLIFNLGLRVYHSHTQIGVLVLMFNGVLSSSLYLGTLSIRELSGIFFRLGLEQDVA